MSRHMSRPTLRVIAGAFASPSDEDLLAAHARGDPEAFAELVRRYQRPVFRVALRFARDRDEAEDLAQRTFLRALAHASRIEPSGTFKSWLFRVVSNLAKNHLRDRARLVFGAPADAPAEPEGDDPERLARARRMREALSRVPRRQRQVMTLRIDAELSFSEIASALGITENNAKVCFHLGTKRIKKLLAEGGAAP